MPLTNNDLKLIFFELIENHFKNLKRPNSVKIKFGKKAKRRLGSIWFDPTTHTSIITITGYLTNPNIPIMIAKAVLAHELVHYFTGFGSTQQKEYQHAHRGSVIKKEMAKYGLEDLYVESEKWIKENWLSVIRKNSRFNIKTLEKENSIQKVHKIILKEQSQFRFFKRS